MNEPNNEIRPGEELSAIVTEARRRWTGPGGFPLKAANGVTYKGDILAVTFTGDSPSAEWVKWNAHFFNNITEDLFGRSVVVVAEIIAP